GRYRQPGLGPFLCAAGGRNGAARGTGPAVHSSPAGEPQRSHRGIRPSRAGSALARRLARPAPGVCPSYSGASGTGQGRSIRHLAAPHRRVAHKRDFFETQAPDFIKIGRFHFWGGAIRAPELPQYSLGAAMSKQHPIIAVTGSSGAGTTTVKRAMEHIFRRLDLTPAVIEGDSFHRYNRQEMKVAIAKAAEEGRNMSHFGPEA